MRTDKELLELLLKEFPNKFKILGVNGLCYCIDLLNLKETEKIRLFEILDLNKTEYFLLNVFGFYFPPRQTTIRQKYLKQLIEKYK